MRQWWARLKAQDIAALAYLAFVIILALSMFGNDRLWDVLGRPAKRTAVIIAFAVLAVLAVIAFFWGRE